MRAVRPAAVRPAVTAWLAYVALALCLTWPLPMHLGTALPRLAYQVILASTSGISGSSATRSRKAACRSTRRRS